MNILVIGSGGREHSICWAIKKSPQLDKLYCIPGNAGISDLATCIPEKDLTNENIIKVCKEFKIDLVVIGPEAYLVNGLSDILIAENIRVFGPNKDASILESSKSFTKNLCSKYGIPTAKYETFSNKNYAYEYLEKQNVPIVIKADGLASGKGVIIANSKPEAFKAVDEIFSGKFGESGKIIVIEEYLEGTEASFFAISDGNNVIPFTTAEDYKRVFEKNKGPNTGGMGAYSPAPIVSKELEKKIISKIIIPTLNALKRKKNAYNGFLYVGLMIKNNEPFLIEYNIRMGDPECQVILPRLKTDIVKIFIDTIKNKLTNTKIKWKKQKSMTIVLCSKGYPGKYKKNSRISNLNQINYSKNDYIYHAGTKLFNQEIRTNGGRVLNITSVGDSFSKIRKKIIKIIKKINWKDGFYRKDIGWKVINKK